MLVDELEQQAVRVAGCDHQGVIACVQYILVSIHQIIVVYLASAFSSPAVRHTPRNTNYNDAALLWSIIRSSVMQKQFHHIASGYPQRGISKEHLHELRFPIPVKDRTVIKE